MKYALVIGNTIYNDSKLAQLKTPEADSIALANVLSDAQIGGFDSVKSLVNKNDFEIRIEISSFFSSKKPEDLLLLYFSGHGILDERGRLFLALQNTQTNYLKATAISSSFISEEMDSCRSRRQVLVLDCCNSGAFERGTKGEHKAMTETTFQGEGYGHVVLTATDSTQYAFEGDQVISRTDLSLFTHFLIDGMQTGAADIDNDGDISLDELYDYVYEKTTLATPKQIPQKWSYHQQGSLIVAKNPVYELLKREAAERIAQEESARAKAEQIRLEAEEQARQKAAIEKAEKEAAEKARLEPIKVTSRWNTHGKIVSVWSSSVEADRQIFIANLAAQAALTGMRVGLADTDFHFPITHNMFGFDVSKPWKTLSDFLDGRATIGEVGLPIHESVGQIEEISKLAYTHMWLFPASVNPRDIIRIDNVGFDTRLLNDGFRDACKKFNLDCLFINQPSNLNEGTLISIAISNALIIVVRPDNKDYHETAMMADVVRQLEIPNLFLTINKTLPKYDFAELKSRFEQTYGIPVLGVLPPFVDIENYANTGIFSINFPSHIWSRGLCSFAQTLFENEI